MRAGKRARKSALHLLWIFRNRPFILIMQLGVRHDVARRSRHFFSGVLFYPVVEQGNALYPESSATARCVMLRSL
jgi:hypothetical protein